MRRILLAALAACCLCADLHAQAIAVSLAGRAMPSRLTADSLRWDDEVVAAALAICPLSRATTYYIDADAPNDSGTGAFGSPWKTIAKANTELAASSGNVAILFQRGDVWTETTGLNVAKSNVTIGAYGTGARPLFNFFGANTLASGGTLWTQAGGTNRYTATVVQPGWIRESLNRMKAYRRVATTGEVESTANSFYWSGGTLHLHATNAAGSAVDPDTIAWEYTRADMTDDSAVDVSSGYTGVRIDSIEAHGWGLDGAATNQEYGVKVQATGTNVVMVSNCGSYYNERHCLGHNPGAVASGGLVVWIANDCGYCHEPAASPFVFYAGSGGQEDVMLGNTIHYGSLRTPLAANYPSGIAVYAHTNSDSTRAALLVCKDTVVKAPANGGGCHAGVQFQNNPTCTSAADCKTVIINTVMEKGSGAGANGYGGHAFCLPYSLELGGRYQFAPLNMTGDALVTNLPTGWMIGTSVELDLSGTTDDYFSFWNNSGVVSPHLWHCAVHVLSNGTTDFSLLFQRNFDTNYANDLAASFRNSVFAVQRTNPASTADVIRVGLGANSPTTLRYNAVFGLSADGTYNGISNATGTVQLGRMPTFGQAVWAGGTLAGASAESLVEFDALLRSRHPATPSIGPVELASQDLQRPTAAELYALMADRFDEIVADTAGIEEVVNDVYPLLVDLDAKVGTPAGASVSADIAAIEAQTDDIGAAGAGLTAITASLSPVSADLIAARVLAARGDFYPNRQQVWALQRGATGITVKNSFEITKRAGETLKVWVDFAGILGRNEFVQTINSISTSGGTVTLVASSEGITGNLVYVEMTGGANGNTAVLSITVTTTEGQVITVNATELNVVS